MSGKKENLRVLVVTAGSGSDGHCAILARIAGSAAEEAGAGIDRLDLSATPLPLFRPDGEFAMSHPIVAEVRARAREAAAFILVTPEYHGSMSGAMKNFLDFHYSEFAGKLFGLVASTGSSRGHSCLSHMRASVLYCHGWTLPYQTASRYSDFDESGTITNPDLLDRLRRTGRDVATYGRVLRGQFERDLTERSGFAGWH